MGTIPTTCVHIWTQTAAPDEGYRASQWRSKCLGAGDCLTQASLRIEPKRAYALADLIDLAEALAYKAGPVVVDAVIDPFALSLQPLSKPSNIMSV